MRPWTASSASSGRTVGGCGWWDRFRMPHIKTDGTSRPTPPGQWRYPWSALVEPWGFKWSIRGIQELEHSTPLTASIGSPGQPGLRPRLVLDPQIADAQRIGAVVCTSGLWLCLNANDRFRGEQIGPQVP